MATETANERNLLDTYVSSATADQGKNYKYIGILEMGGNYFTLLKMKSHTEQRRKIMSKKIVFKLFQSRTAASNLYAYKLIDEWDANVTYLTLPLWSSGTLIGTVPGTAVAGDIFEFDLDAFSLDDLETNGIMLHGDNSESIRCTGTRSLTAPSDAVYIEITYADAPDLPTDLTPSAGANVEITSGFGRFSWKYNPSTVSGLPQKAYNLQLSSDGLTWTTINATSADQYADVAVASIPSGDFYWRVQTIDTDDVPSDYSAQQYAYYGTAPAAPTIITSVFASSKPRIEWSTAYAQAGYRVQILLGEVSVIDATVETADAFYDVPVALADDTQYTVRVTVKDTSAHYSAWAEDAISTDYAVPEVPTFFITKKKDSVDLTITNPTGEAVIRNDIYRLEGTEYIRIGSTTGTTYTDWSVGTGIQTYKVAAVGASGEAVSAAAEVDFAVDGTFLTAVDDAENPFEVKYNALDQSSAEHNLTLVEYAGRDKPVAEFGEVIQRSVYVTFDSDDQNEYARLNDILSRQSVVLFRNARQKIYGVCTNQTEQPEDYLGLAYNLSFVVNEIEHSEVV
jgi:hypothetical protein